MTGYDSDFYRRRHERTVYSARTILTRVLGIVPATKSAVDVGCGVGTWLSVLREKGVADIQGVDGPWVEKGLLEIPESAFIQADLSRGMVFHRRFDLAISLEVAEHIPAEAAQTFITSLTKMSDFVLFSAAIPFQTGTHHVNEQWPDYWAHLFRHDGYVVLDCIRREIWDDKNIPVWYRQNILMFVKPERMAELRMPEPGTWNQCISLSVVHPDSYTAKARQMSSVLGAWRLLRTAVRKSVRRKLRRRGRGQ